MSNRVTILLGPGSKLCSRSFLQELSSNVENNHDTLNVFQPGFPLQTMEDRLRQSKRKKTEAKKTTHAAQKLQCDFYNQGADLLIKPLSVL